MVSKAIFSSLERRPILITLTILFFGFNFLLKHFISAEYALDLKFAYSVDQAYQAIGSLSKSELNMYQFGIWALDFPYMVVYGLLATGLLYKLWRNKKLVFVPLFIVLFDGLENILISQLLENFPQRHEDLAIFASVFTTFKWVSAVFLIILLLLGITKFYKREKLEPAKNLNPEMKNY